MSLSLGAGSVVQVAPPALPVVTVTLPATSTVVVPLAGPPGPAGTTGFTYTQAVAQAIWIVPHNLGRYPAAWSLIETSSGRLCAEYNVEHLDVNTCRISMDTPTAGIIRLI